MDGNPSVVKDNEEDGHWKQLAIAVWGASGGSGKRENLGRSMTGGWSLELEPKPKAGVGTSTTWKQPTHQWILRPLPCHWPLSSPTDELEVRREGVKSRGGYGERKAVGAGRSSFGDGSFRRQKLSLGVNGSSSRVGQARQESLVLYRVHKLRYLWEGKVPYLP